ncbi:ABC transporter substrate-binding protein [Parapedobacter sp. 10938]|uniref:ABC transporter substrate-binding protein n=1 Tax=Parapedobacter flavus TaxID=3110225 RepID=UPI002DB8FFB5|nr:hypothetical protein [Parapedobacter sp. 10938]MEC3881585.1 hypothetical protein [Parapedobacter sp. 10938]
MRSTPLSLQSILTALDLDTACLPLLEQAPHHEALLRAHTPDAVYTAIHDIGNTLHAASKADQLVEDLEERINIITHKLKFIADENKPRVLFLADLSPVQLISDAYLETAARTAGGIPISLLTEGISADVIVVISETPMPQLLAALPALLAAPEWAQTTAVKQGNVFIIHHPDHLRQPGALIGDDIEILAEILHPKQFIFGRDEDAWMKFEVQ